MIKKLDGTYRFCVDFRKLNSVSKKDAYLLPYMNAILNKLRSARYIDNRYKSSLFPDPSGKRKSRVDSFHHAGEGPIPFYANAIRIDRSSRNVSDY